MTDARLPDWPPANGETIGTERAGAYVRWIAEHAPPLVEAATQVIRVQRPGSEPRTSSASVAQLAGWTLGASMAGLAIGCVWADVHAGDFAMVDIVIRRDGRLEMRPGRHVTG
jgi:hypothetical protein